LDRQQVLWYISYMNIILFDAYPEDGRIPLTDDRARHIKKVLRLTVGDSFLMGIVNGGSGRARISPMDNEAVTISWKEEIPPQPLFPVTLMVGQVRPISMKRILREAVSMGVEKLILVGTDTGERSYRDARLWETGEYHRYLLSGAEQSGMTALPRVLFFDTVDSMLAEISSNREYRDLRVACRIVLDNIDPQASLSTMAIPSAEQYVLAVGSERGWSDRERELLKQAGYAAASLGRRILRTETACSAGTAVLLGRLGMI